jgi:hypothetical protein
LYLLACATVPVLLYQYFLVLATVLMY